MSIAWILGCFQHLIARWFVYFNYGCDCITLWPFHLCGQHTRHFLRFHLTRKKINLKKSHRFPITCSNCIFMEAHTRLCHNIFKRFISNLYIDIHIYYILFHCLYRSVLYYSSLPETFFSFVPVLDNWNIFFLWTTYIHCLFSLIDIPAWEIFSPHEKKPYTVCCWAILPFHGSTSSTFRWYGSWEGLSLASAWSDQCPPNKMLVAVV